MSSRITLPEYLNSSAFLLAAAFVGLTYLFATVTDTVEAGETAGVAELVIFAACVVIAVAALATLQREDALSTILVLSGAVVAVACGGTLYYYSVALRTGYEPAFRTGNQFFWAAFSAGIVLVGVAGAAVAANWARRELFGWDAGF